MSSKTLLDTCKAVTGELGFIQPTAVMSSQVLTDIQLRHLVVAACDELLDMHNWQSLVKKHTFTVTSAATYPLPSDYYRMIDQSAFIGTQQLDGAPSTMTWTRLQSGERTFRIIGDLFELFEPTAHTGEVVTFYYVSKNYVIDSTTLLKDSFQQDSDKAVFPARLLTNFVKLKLLQTKNLDSRSAAQDFNAILETVIANDVPSRVLTLNGEARLAEPLPWAEY